MKRITILLTAVMSSVMASAMSYSEARREALYLTDKMAYELSLTEQQYNDAYEINLDYLMGVRSVDEVYGTYWRYRNADLRSILYDWQWDMFRAADYFFRPLTWRSGVWYMPVRHRYAHDCFYYARPRVYVSYRGGHHRVHYSAGYYASHRPIVVHNVHHHDGVVARNGGHHLDHSHGGSHNGRGVGGTHHDHGNRGRGDSHGGRSFGHGR